MEYGELRPERGEDFAGDVGLLRENLLWLVDPFGAFQLDGMELPRKREVDAGCIVLTAEDHNDPFCALPVELIHHITSYLPRSDLVGLLLFRDQCLTAVTSISGSKDYCSMCHACYASH